MQQIWPELVAEPEVPVDAAAHRLDVEVGAGQQPLARVAADDVEGDLAVGIAQRDELADADLAAAAASGLEVGLDAVHPQQEVGGVRLGPEPVVGHRKVLAAVGQHGGEALHGLARKRRGATVDRRRCELRPRRWTRGEGVGRQHGASEQPGRVVVGGAMGDLRRNTGEQQDECERDLGHAASSTVRVRAGRGAPQIRLGPRAARERSVTPSRRRRQEVTDSMARAGTSPQSCSRR